jgi:alpha-aminoadipic semialdehyde synthase
MKKFVIRAEQKNQWEGRTSLAPVDAAKVIKDFGLDISVEPSKKRAFSMDEYLAAGVKQADSSTEYDVIVGVKEIPIELLSDTAKTYIFFSHTIKGQKENMPALQKIMDSGSTLIDYEKIVNENGIRLVAFGYHAGVVGAVDSLWILGQKLKAQGVNTPLADFKQALDYETAKVCREHLSELGNQIKIDGFGTKTPLKIAVLGEGNVSRGASSVLECLPIKEYELKDFLELDDSDLDPGLVHVCTLGPQHLVERTSDGGFEFNEYVNSPEQYQPVFNKYWTRFDMIINCIFWAPEYPVFVTSEMLRSAHEANTLPLVLGDITCDIDGSMKCTLKPTEPGDPCYTFNGVTGEMMNGWNGEGITVLAVDNLPCEFSRDSSEYFSHAMGPFWESINQMDLNQPLEDSGLALELQEATIVYNGKLTKKFEYISEFLG